MVDKHCASDDTNTSNPKPDPSDHRLGRVLFVSPTVCVNLSGIRGIHMASSTGGVRKTQIKYLPTCCYPQSPAHFTHYYCVIRSSLFSLVVQSALQCSTLYYACVFQPWFPCHQPFHCVRARYHRVKRPMVVGALIGKNKS